MSEMGGWDGLGHEFTWQVREVSAHGPIVEVLVNGKGLGIQYYADTLKDLDSGLLLHGGLALSLTPEQGRQLREFCRGVLAGVALDASKS